VAVSCRVSRRPVPSRVRRSREPAAGKRRRHRRREDLLPPSEGPTPIVEPPPSSLLLLDARWKGLRAYAGLEASSHSDPNLKAGVPLTLHKSNPGGEQDYQAIDRHLRGFWPGAHFHDFSWTKGPIQQVLPRFRVRRITPASAQDAWVYVTKGAFEADGGQRLEFIIEAPAEDPIHVESLAMVTYRHLTGPPLDLGQTVAIGRPWITGSPQDHFMVDLPYPFGPKLEWAELPNGEPVRFLWLVPITASEAEYARTHGADALGDLLEQNQADVLDPQRRSVV